MCGKTVGTVVFLEVISKIRLSETRRRLTVLGGP